MKVIPSVIFITLDETTLQKMFVANGLFVNNYYVFNLKKIHLLDKLFHVYLIKVIMFTWQIPRVYDNNFES